jgi:8-oxo-dGTP pyrophosphatase MutT (NUDIX family)
VSALHSDALALLTTWVAPDDSQELLRRQYVAHLVRHPDGLSRSCLPDHITASTLVLSADCKQVLLTLHGKARQWFQFGGHVEPGDITLSGAARREATEESGIAGLELDPAPVHLDTHAVPFCGGPGTRHLDVRFVAVAPAVATPEVSAESVDVRWWPVEELPTDEPSMRRLVDLGRDRLRQV